MMQGFLTCPLFIKFVVNLFILCLKILGEFEKFVCEVV